MMTCRALCWLVIAPIVAFAAVELNPGTPAQCEPLTVSWKGGSPPFVVTVVPPGRDIIRHEVPDSAFSNGEGTFTTEGLPLQATTDLMVAITDSTGQITTSEFLTVTDSVAQTRCNTTPATVDFFYNLDSPLIQCGEYPFTSYDRGVLPFLITFFVPGGTSSFTRQSPSSGTQFTTLANVTAGKTIIFYLTDAVGKSGGTSGKKPVVTSSNKSCLTEQPNSTTSGAPGPTNTGNGSGRSTNIGVIAGAAAGGLVVAGIIVFIALMLIRKRNKQQGGAQRIDLNYDPVLPSDPDSTYLQSNYALTPFNYTTPSNNSTTYNNTPPVSYEYGPGPTSPTVASGSQYPPSRAQSSSRVSSFSEPSSSSGATTSGRISKQRPVVVHTDITDVDEPEELPPQYSESRAPIPGFSQPGVSSTPVRQGKQLRG